MRNTFQTVIVGAGIVGVATAAELAKRGHTDVLVIDQAPLFRTGGSTSHAPGGVFQNSSSRTVSKLAQWTVDTFIDVSAEDSPTYFPVSSLEIATTPQRWHDLHRKYGYARSWGLEAALLTPAETGTLLPQLDASLILGSIQVQGDGIVRAIPTVERLAGRASTAGIIFRGNTTCTGIQVRNGQVESIETSEGVIACEQVLLCGGIWGPMLGELAGIAIPLQPCAHPYLRSTPLSELCGHREVQQPLWRHQDHSMYLWQDGDRMGVGNYRHELRLVAPEAICNDTDAPAELPWDEDAMAPGWQEAQRLVPALRNAGITDRVNGLFSFTPDAQSIIGEVASVRGLWTAMAVWVTHAGGTGRVLADLMTTGDCELDLREVDVNRFSLHQTSRSFVSTRGSQQYREVYDIIHPRYQISQPRGLRRAPWYDQQVKLGTHFFESNGWERAQWYEANAAQPQPETGCHRDSWSAIEWSPIAGAEHIATRQQAGLFDLSTCMRIDISGSGAMEAMRRLSCSNVDRPPGKVGYILMLSPDGGIVSDVTYTKLEEDHYLLLTSSASGPRDFGWVVAHTREIADVQVRDVTSAWCAVGLWGPMSRKILAPVLEGDLSPTACPPYAIRQVFIAGLPVFAIRMSYVGEDGFELHTSSEYGGALWDALWQAGQAAGLVAAGGAAMDTLRLERGYRALGTDLRSEYTPANAGLDYLIDQNRSDAIGANALQRTATKRLCCFALDDPDTVLLGKEPILVDGAVVGYVSSAGFGYTVQRSLALGYLPVALAQPGQRVELEYFGRLCGATVMVEPLYK